MLLGHHSIDRGAGQGQGPDGIERAIEPTDIFPSHEPHRHTQHAPRHAAIETFVSIGHVELGLWQASARRQRVFG